VKWRECLKHKVKKIKPDRERAVSLQKLAAKRQKSIERRRNTEEPEFLIEDYYEVIKELITAILAVKGYKSYSHECLISYLEEKQSEIEASELKMIDQLRQTRNDLLYRGTPVAKGLLKRREKEIRKVIEKLKTILEKHLDTD